jgi:tetratricopeptide (TPR) repeat protein
MRRGWKVFFWPLVCLFQLGLIAGTLILGSRLTEPDSSANGEKPVQPVEPSPLAADWKKECPEPEMVHAARGELDDVDNLLRASRYELALVLCRSHSDRAVAELRYAYQYRLGLCLEGLGHWDEALAAYRNLASRAASIRTAAIAALGQARVWLRIRRPTESKSLLCDVLRRSALPGLRGQPFLADARYLLALAAPLELLPNQPPGPLNDTPVCPLTSDWSLESALDWDRPGRQPEPEPLNGQEVVEVQPDGDGLVRIYAAQIAAQSPLTGLLDRLAEQAHLRIEWSAAARKQVEERSLIVALESTSLPETLRLLVEPLGLVWTLSDGKLSLTSEDETAPADLKSRRLANARRSLREALRAYPRHPLTPAAYLELGNLEALTGHLDEALAWYGRLAREWPRSPLGVEAHYNIGLLRSRQGDRAAARQAFYHVVDRAPAHELAPLTYWRIGRIHLEQGEVEQALSPLRRAVHNGSGSPAQAAAVLTISAAHLLTDNPRAANAVLCDHRELISRDSYRNAAAFLDTLARFRAANDRRRRQREAADLLAALLTVQDDPLLGPEGLALMGQGYRELGMQGEMTRLYQKALTKLRGPLASKLTLELAEEHWAADKPEAALPLYQKLISGDSSKEGKRARLRLAEIALAEKKSQDCLKFCRELLQEKAEVDVPAVLRLMAQAFEQNGEHDKAIRCLSGQLP